MSAEHGFTLQLRWRSKIVWAKRVTLDSQQESPSPVRIPLPVGLRAPSAPEGGWLVVMNGPLLRVIPLSTPRGARSSTPEAPLSLNQKIPEITLLPDLSLRYIDESAAQISIAALARAPSEFWKSGDQVSAHHLGLLTALRDHAGAAAQTSVLQLRETQGAMALLGLLLAATWLIPHFFPTTKDDAEAPPPPAIAKLLLKPKGGASASAPSQATASKNPTIAARAAAQNVKQLSSTALVQSLKSMSPSLSQFLKRAPDLAVPTTKSLESLKASRSLASLAGSLSAGQAAPSGPSRVGAGKGGTAGTGYGQSAVSGNGLGKGAAQVAIQDLTQNASVQEGLTREEVGRVIHQHLSEIRYCYESTLLSRPNLEGKLTLAFSIRANGTVSTARSENSAFHTQNARAPAEKGESAPQFEDCLIRRLLTWKFPNPKGGVTVAVTYPFVFKSLGQ